MADLLRECATARKTKDFERCRAAAQALVRRDASNSTAWAYLCWALFEQRRYQQAAEVCKEAMAFRDWSFRERSGMAALRASCRLLSRIEGGVTGTHTGGDVDPSPMPGELLRSQWYTQRLVHMTTTGTLLPFPVVDKLPGTPISCGGGVRDCTLIDVRVNSSDLWGSDVHAVEICLGEGGGERTVRANLLKGFPYDQATGGNVYLRDQILAFHCNRLLPNQRGRPCYQGFGPCARCVREGYPIPTHPFPVWDSHQDTSDVIRPNVDLDVLYSTELVSPALHSRIQARVDELACRRQDSPMPLYHNIIDPNLTVDCEGSWFATEFDVAEQLSAAVPAQLVLDHACARATGRRLPFGLSHHIVADLADVGARRLHARMRTAIPGLDPHADHKLHLAVENLLTAALPMLSMLRKPALLLPGPLQVRCELLRFWTVTIGVCRLCVVVLVLVLVPMVLWSGE